MKRKIKVVVIAGTRPEAIKLAPVVLELKKHVESIETILINTRQHPVAADEVFEIFGIQADISLSVQEARQSLAKLSSKLLAQLDEVLIGVKPDYVIVQGDTTSVLCGALAGFYLGAKIVHVEAGLRTSSLRLPFPEEMNCRVVSKIADINCAPTQKAYDTLIAEGNAPESVILTTNTIVDALEYVKELNKRRGKVPTGSGYLLVTMHRRENWGEGIYLACEAIKKICAAHPDLSVKFATHVNPEVQKAVRSELGEMTNVELLPPVKYDDFIALIQGAKLIMSDSGGIVEEAPSLGVHVLITRSETERTEAIEAGCATLVGTDIDLILREANKYLSPEYIQTGVVNPFGDGQASLRIAATIIKRGVLES